MTENVVNNGQVNTISDGVAQGIFEESSTQKGPLGARRALNDGRVLRYSKFTAVAVAAGSIVAIDATSQAIGPTSLNTVVRNSAGTAADIASSDSVTRLYFLDTTLFTAANSNDVLAGGYLHMINSATGGYTYRIKGNSYAAATSLMTVDLYDSILENITSESDVAIIGNLYQNVTIANAGTDDIIVGITVRNMTASYYGWVQTWGPGTVLGDETVGTIAAGTIAVLSDGVDGAAEPLNIGTQVSELDWPAYSFAEPPIGYFLTGAEDTNYVPVFIQISP